MNDLTTPQPNETPEPKHLIVDIPIPPGATITLPLETLDSIVKSLWVR